jgi:hypothetical protein
MVRCRRLLAALSLLAGASQAASAQDSIVFDGELYAKVHSERQSEGNRMVQYVREPETLGNWTRSIAFYRYTTIGNDPTRAAVELRERMAAANPGAQARLIVHSVTRDAIVDFLVRLPDNRYLEFNVVRYAKDSGGKGLVAFRFAHRLRDAGKSEPFDKDRLSWRDQVVEFDLAQIYAVLAD